MTSCQPTLIETRAEYRTPTRLGRAPWVWWHLLSLDAPTVAILWCWFFAAAFGLNFSWVALPTLALGTWCVYVADRLLDGWGPTETSDLRDRHWFYLRHRKPFTIAWLLAAIPLAYLVLHRAQRSVRTDDFFLGLIGVVYFLLIHGPHSNARHSGYARWFPKELAVGFLFAIATAIPTWARLAEHRSILTASVFTFGAACWLNCVAIQVWEDAEDSQEITHTILAGHARSKEKARSRGLTEFLGEHLTGFAGSVGLLSFIFALDTAQTGLWPLFAAVTASSLLFLALIRNSYRFSVLSLRIAADAALLTPLLFLIRVR